MWYVRRNAGKNHVHVFDTFSKAYKYACLQGRDTHIWIFNEWVNIYDVTYHDSDYESDSDSYSC